jgi:Probable zinc-ribbon domain
VIEEPILLTCRDCGVDFRYGIGEQRLFTERGFPPPTRCRDCRTIRKIKREALNERQHRDSRLAV